LSQADFVYEYIVDGFSLTRITAMYQSQDADRVGPVRSARYPNIWMVQMFGGMLACSGGSDAIRYLLKNEVGFPYLDADIDDPSNNRLFHEPGQRLPHALAGAHRRRAPVAGRPGHRRWTWDKPGFTFSDDARLPALRGRRHGDLDPLPRRQRCEWRYDPVSGRLSCASRAAQQQFDPATNQPIVASNVIVQSLPRTKLTDIVEDSLGTKGVNIKLHEFGDLRVFRDGKVYEGTWRASQETPAALARPR
jgi:hypothetical protein